MTRRGHALLWLLPILLFLPALAIDRNALFGNTDALFYTMLMKLSGEQFMHGDFWPFWLKDADIGMGAPLMYTFPSVPYLLTAVLSEPLKLAGVGVGMRMLFGMYLATVASGYTAFFWLRSQFPQKQALAGGLLYALLPYRLIYIYLHFNIAQLWALIWLPLWMLSCERMLQGKRFGIAGFAMAAALVNYTHPLTLIAFSGVPAMYLIWTGWKNPNMPQRFFRAGVLAAMLACAYGSTFLEAKDWVISTGPNEGFTGGRFSVLGNLSHVDSLLLAAYLAIGLLAYLLSRRVPDMPRQCGFFLAVLCVLWVMMLGISAPVWRLVQPLQYLQFPAARLHSGMLVAVVYLATAYLTFKDQAKPLPVFLKPAVLWGVIAAATIASLLRLPAAYHSATGLTADYVETMQRYSIFPLPYRTRWSDIDGKVIYAERQRIEALPQVRFFMGSGAVQVHRWAPGNLAFEVNVESGSAVVVVRQRYVPVWRAFDSSDKQRLRILPIAHDGTMALNLQRGRHNIWMQLVSEDTASSANTLSALTLAAIMGYLLIMGVWRRA